MTIIWMFYELIQQLNNFLLKKTHQKTRWMVLEILLHIRAYFLLVKTLILNDGDRKPWCITSRGWVQFFKRNCKRWDILNSILSDIYVLKCYADRLSICSYWTRCRLILVSSLSAQISFNTPMQPQQKRLDSSPPTSCALCSETWSTAAVGLPGCSLSCKVPAEKKKKEAKGSSQNLYA